MAGDYLCQVTDEENNKVNRTIHVYVHGMLNILFYQSIYTDVLCILYSFYRSNLSTSFSSHQWAHSNIRSNPRIMLHGYLSAWLPSQWKSLQNMPIQWRMVGAYCQMCFVKCMRLNYLLSLLIYKQDGCMTVVCFYKICYDKTYN